MGCPSAPLRRGPDGPEFWLQGTMLRVAPVSSKYLSLVNLSVKKIKPVFAGKCIAVAVACVGKSRRTERGSAANQFSDQEQGGMHLLALLA
jgi:hypothetical protein